MSEREWRGVRGWSIYMKDMVAGYALGHGIYVLVILAYAVACLADKVLCLSLFILYNDHRGQYECFQQWSLS
jgi:hypothetical protein